VTAKRLAAVVTAALLVVGAFALRRGVIEDDDEPAAGDDPAETVVDVPAGSAVVCVTELRAACEALEDEHEDLTVTVEDAGVTLDRLAALEDSSEAPVWLTIDPFPAMVDALRPNDPVGFESVPVASSRLAIAFPTDGEADALDAFCASEAQRLWHCIGANAGQAWSDLGNATIPGALNPSLGRVPESALALTSFGNAVASYFGTPDVSASRFGETAFITWLRNLSGTSEGRTQRGSTPLATMAVRPALDAAATASFEVTAIDDAGDEFDVSYPDPQMWIQAVIATPAGVAAPDDLATELGELLVTSGWDRASAAGAPPPNASTLLALRSLWNDFT
jgi:hypothetical protein